MFCLHKATSAVSCVKPNASQWEARLCDDVRFLTVYRRIYHRRLFHWMQLSPFKCICSFFSIEKMYYLHKATSAVSCVKPSASQWEASCDDVGFLTVYRRIYHRKFFLLSNQTAGLGGSVGYSFDWRPGGREFNPRRGWQHSFVEIDDEIFSTVILSLPLIQEGQMSVSGKRMFIILVNRLED